MRVIADLHVHSKYARATSSRCDIKGLAQGAEMKGIGVIATGDFTHPLYFREIKTLLEDDGSGLYPYGGVRFILSGEISLIYGKRRMHHIVLAPSLDVAAQVNDALSKRGNLASDGRPILGLSSPEFADILFSISRDIMLIPAHVWTPWFSVFGSKSGVDTIEEAFEDQARNIFALETGLSSDPAMNWMLSSLDKYTLVSNSDAHSLDKLGREANVLDLPRLTYDALARAIRTREGFVKTYEFYPEEGKYHYDGHRSCKVLLSPLESEKHGNICPVCRKPLTVGVLHRVMDLADRKMGSKPENAVPFQYIIPLKTLISKTIRKGENTQAVMREYGKLMQCFGNEFSVFEAEDEQIRLSTSAEISESILKAKRQDVRWIPGHDGVFGELVLEERGAKNIVDRKQRDLTDF